ncbi:MAG: leucine-rich repeat domain-containing protein [Promethearchaeota archaeon]
MARIESILCPTCERYLKPGRKGLICRYCNLIFNHWGEERKKMSYGNYKPYNKHIFKANDYITLKLEHNQTYIYVKGTRFLQCIRLVLDIQKDNIRDYDEIDSIDEAADIFKQSLWQNRIVEGPMARPSRFQNETITPEQEFWGHCSNIQAWVEHDYDTRILYRNMAFPLLRELTRQGDPKARRVFKEEIAMRFASGHPTVIQYLINEGYLQYLDSEELDSLIEYGMFTDYFIENGRYDILIKVSKSKESLETIIKKILVLDNRAIDNSFRMIKNQSASRLSAGLAGIIEDFDNGRLNKQLSVRVKKLFNELFIPNLLDSDKSSLLNNPHSLLHKYYIKAGDSIFRLINGDTLSFKNVKSVFLKNLDLIKNPEKVKKIIIDNVGNLKIHFLNHFKNLEELSLQNNQIYNINGIDKLINLKRLQLQDNRIIDISNLSYLENLKYLNLENNIISSYRGLENLTNLTHLVLACNKISKLSDLSPLKNLILLDLSHNNISNIDCEKLPKITQIDLTQNPIVLIKNHEDNFAISYAVTFDMSLFLEQDKMTIKIKDIPTILLRKDEVFINQGGFWYKSGKMGKNLPGFASVEEISSDISNSIIEVNELYLSKFSDYRSHETKLLTDFKELCYTLKSWIDRNYCLQILQKQIALPLLRKLKNVKSLIFYNGENNKNIVGVPVEKFDKNDKPVREFKTYKIIKRLK